MSNKDEGDSVKSFCVKFDVWRCVTDHVERVGYLFCILNLAHDGSIVRRHLYRFRWGGIFFPELYIMYH